MVYGKLLVPQIDPSVPQPVFKITEKAPTRAFSWLKEPNSTFTFKTLCMLNGLDLWYLSRHPNFTSSYRGVNACFTYCLNSVLNVKALVGAFNQEKALVGAFSVIAKTDCETDGSFYSIS